MKNLIITLGLVLLMTMGILHDADSAAVLIAYRSTNRICGEMADAAEICMEQGGTLDAAESAAWEVLQKSEEENLVWELSLSGNTIHVKVKNRDIALRLPLVRQGIQIVIDEEREI